MRIALYEPNIPQNTGTILRLGACLGVPVDIIEPCGFVFDDKRLRRSGMDYLDQVDWTRHRSWSAFLEARYSDAARLILLTTKGEFVYTRFSFAPGDILLLGRESAGVPDRVHVMADATVRIPTRPGTRSLNVALSAAMVAGEALRQTPMA